MIEVGKSYAVNGAMACFFVAGGVLGFWAGTKTATLNEAVEVHFAPEEDLSAVDVGLIKSAANGEAIDAALYVATECKVMGALADAAARGCRVRVYLDAEQAAKANWRTNLDHPMHRLIADGGEVRMKATGAPLMHLKGYTIGGRLLRTGSANVSYDGLNRQDNHVLVIRDAAAVAAFQRKFEAVWPRPDNVGITGSKVSGG
jgi:phosphatidylserine/phosphatidylglycerophosphate/cardiolipin synthase-like enzyme